MIIKYDINIQDEAILNNFKRITNQIFKLLPSREEGGNWESPLDNLILEIGGMSELLKSHINLFSLLCKLEALKSLNGEDDFFAFRRIIFECLNICTSIQKEELNGRI